MAITLVGTFGAGVDTGNLTVTLPVGISHGDAVGAFGVCSNATTLTAPPGWVTRAAFPLDYGNSRFYVWRKTDVTASDAGAAQTFVTSATNKVVVAGFALRSPNGFPADWIDDLQWAGVQASSYTAPASTSHAPGCWGVAAFYARGTGPAAWTPAAGLTERQDLRRAGSGATTLHLTDSNGSVGPTGTVWGPFTEANINAGGGGLTLLVAEQPPSVEGDAYKDAYGGGTEPAPGVVYPKLGLWRQHDSDGGWRTRMNLAESIYGPFQGRWTQYFGVGSVPLSAEVTQAINDGKHVHVFWKPYSTDWAQVASGGRDAQLDQAAASIAAVAPANVWLTIHHEPEDDYIAHGSGGVGWTAANYRGMWQRVRARFDLAGVTNVTWVLVWQHSHSHPAEMLTLYGNDGVMDSLVDVMSQQDYIISSTTPQTLATKWIEDLEWARTNESTGRHWSYLSKPQAFTEWGADLGGQPANRGTNLHRAQTIDAIRGILPDLASRNVVSITYFDDGSNDIDDPPAVDGVAFQALKDASEAGQQAAPVVVAGVALARDGATGTATTIPFTLPSGWQQGDLAEVWITSNTLPDISTTPTGWQLQEGPVANGSIQRAWRYSKVLQAGETNPTWTISTALRPSGIMVLLRGADGATPVHASAALTATSSATSHAAAAVTTTSASAFILTAWLTRWADASSNNGVNYPVPPGSHTTDAAVSVNSGANAGTGGLVAHLTASPVGSGSHGPYTAAAPVTCVGICGQLAILPAGIASNPTVTETGTATDTLQVATGPVPKTLADTGAAANTLSVAQAGGAPAQTVPQVKVEIAFTTQPMAATPTWTDVTNWVQWPIQIDRGRADEFAAVEPGTLRLQLNNPDGRFTMGNTAGAYSPNVKVGKRIRVTLTYQATAYTRFDGHINGWPMSWVGNATRTAVVEVTATDRLKRLGRPGELRSMLDEEALRDAPLAAYPLTEEGHIAAAGNQSALVQGAAVVTRFDSGVGDIGFGAADGPPGADDQRVPLFAPTSSTVGKYLRAVLHTPPSAGTGLALGAFFRTEGGVTGRTILALKGRLGQEWRLLLDATGRLQAFHFDPVEDTATRLYDIATAAAYNDDVDHHVALVESLAGGVVTARLYVDGTQVQTATHSLAALGRPPFLLIGSDGQAGQLWAGTISHVAIHDQALPAARVSAHAHAGLDGLAGERTDQRLARIADWIGIPAADRALDTGDKLMGGQATAGQQPLEVMRQVEQVEQGVLFVSGAGKLVFHRRSRRYNTTPVLTLNAGHQTEYLSDDNRGFEATVGTWANEANAATPIRTVGHARTGIGSMLMESVAAGSMTVRHAPAPALTNGVQVQPSTAYRVSGAFRSLGDAPLQPRVGMVAHGASADDVAAFVTAAGKGIAIEHWFEAWHTNYNTGFNTTKATTVHNAGRTNLITWEPWDTTGGATQPTYTLASIAGGSHDAHITAWAQGAAAFGQPIFLRWGHEMNGDWYPWGTKGGVNGNTPAQYVQAWQRIYGIFAAQGADNVTFVWCPNRPFTGSTAMASLYPGDGYVDWMGLDAYNHGTDQGGSWLSVATTFDAGFAELRAVNSGKPVMICETGCSTNGGDKAAWITDLFTALPTTYAYVRALVYFNHNKLAQGSSNFRIQDPAAAQTAYAAGIANARYAASRTAAFGTSALRPVQVGVNWYDAAGTFISTVFGSAPTETPDAWTTPPVLEVTSPSNAARAIVLARVQSIGAAGEQHYVDDVSFTVQPGSPGHIQVGAVFPSDDFGLVNDMTVARPGGATQRAISDASIAEFGLYRDALEIPANTDNDTLAVAQWRVEHYGTPRTRLPNLTISLKRLNSQSTPQTSSVLGLEISSMIRLTNLPSQAPASTVDLFVEGWTEVIDRKTGDWSIQLNTSPAANLQVWQLGVAGFSELGVTTRLAL